MLDWLGENAFLAIPETADVTYSSVDRHAVKRPTLPEAAYSAHCLHPFAFCETHLIFCSYSTIFSAIFN